MNEVIHNRTQIYLDWPDRLKVLFGKVIHVDVDVEIAQPEVTIVETTSRTWVEEIFPRKRQGGYAATPSEETR